MVDSEISFVASSQSGLYLLQLLVLAEKCITQNEDLGCRIDLCSLTIAGWLWHGDGTSFLLTFEICLKTGNLSRDKPKVVVSVSTEDGNRNYISASTISLFKALCQLYLINLQDSTAIQGNRDH